MSKYVKVCITDGIEQHAKVIPVSGLYAILWSPTFREKGMYQLKRLLRIMNIAQFTFREDHTPMDAGLVYANLQREEVIYCLADGTDNVIDAVPFQPLLDEIQGKTFDEPKKLDDLMGYKLGQTFSQATLFNQMFEDGLLDGAEYLSESGIPHIDTGYRLSRETNVGERYVVANSYSNNPPNRYPFKLPFRVQHVDVSDVNLISKVAMLAGIPEEQLDRAGFKSFQQQHEAKQRRAEAKQPRLSDEVLWGSLNLAI